MLLISVFTLMFSSLILHFFWIKDISCAVMYYWEICLEVSRNIQYLVVGFLWHDGKLPGLHWSYHCLPAEGCSDVRAMSHVLPVLNSVCLPPQRPWSGCDLGINGSPQNRHRTAVLSQTLSLELNTFLFSFSIRINLGGLVEGMEGC